MSTISANTFLAADGTTTTEPSIPALDQRMAKAWVNFNGQDAVAINGAYNVSSLTDNGTGQTTVNFAVTLSQSIYSGVVSSANVLSDSGNSDYLRAKTSSSCQVRTLEDGTYRDAYDVNVIIFGP